MRRLKIAVKSSRFSFKFKFAADYF